MAKGLTFEVEIDLTEVALYTMLLLPFVLFIISVGVYVCSLSILEESCSNGALYLYLAIGLSGVLLSYYGAPFALSLVEKIRKRRGKGVVTQNLQEFVEETEEEEENKLPDH